jgi:hypothetical protein
MRIRRALLACALALPVAFAAVPAEAAGPIKIHRIYFDSPGPDHGSNRSLNAEFIVLKNTGSRARSLRGWRIRDAAGHSYSFGAYRLGAGKKVTIHTGRGANRPRHRYWRQGWYVWNNDGDTARLVRRNGTRADRCRYNGAGSSVYC